MAVDFSKLDPAVLSDVMERLGVDSPSKLPPCSVREVFEYWCEWNGFINWSDKILSTVEKIKAAEIDNQSA